MINKFIFKEAKARRSRPHKARQHLKILIVLGTVDGPFGLPTPMARRKAFNRIKELRTLHCPSWTQEDLARASGVPAQTISAYEALDREPRLWAAFCLAAALGVAVEELFYHHHALASARVLRREGNENNQA